MIGKEKSTYRYMYNLKNHLEITCLNGYKVKLKSFLQKPVKQIQLLLGDAVNDLDVECHAKLINA